MCGTLSVMTSPSGACRFCDEEHPANFMCPPARRVLDALIERGTRFDMPTIEFDEPVEGVAGMLGDGTVLIRQLVVKAGLLPVAGTPRPTLIFTGQDADGRVLPQWVYPGDIREIKRARRLVCEVADMAIRAARGRPG
jgi:hypothetical protein